MRILPSFHAVFRRGWEFAQLGEARDPDDCPMVSLAGQKGRGGIEHTEGCGHSIGGDTWEDALSLRNRSRSILGRFGQLTFHAPLIKGEVNDSERIRGVNVDQILYLNLHFLFAFLCTYDSRPCFSG